MRFLEQKRPGSVSVSGWTERFRPTRGKIALILIGQFYLEMGDERAVLSLVTKYGIPPPDVSSLQALYNHVWPAFQLHLADEFRKRNFQIYFFCKKIFEMDKFVLKKLKFETKYFNIVRLFLNG